MFSAKALLRFGCVITMALPIAAAFPADSVAAAEASPAATVESFHQVLLNTMKNARSLGPQGRFADLEPVISRSFDIPGILETAIGSDWNKLSGAQQTALSAAFQRFEVAQFAYLFDSYGGQRFRTIGIKPAADDLVVATVMEGDGLPEVRFDYTVRLGTDGWRIEDIRLNAWLGVMERRSAELKDVLRRRGFDGLMASLDRHTRAVLDRADNAASPHLTDLRPDIQTPYPLFPPLP